MAGTIFINYRREDSIDAAGRLRDRLAETFGQKNLFMDVDSIPAGEDFVAYLNNQVAACNVFLAIIGPNWLNVKDESGRRRLDNSDDFVAIEIAAALERSIRVVPVLVGGASMPKASELPDSLKPLARRQAVEVRQLHFGGDAEALIEKIREALGDEAPVAGGRETLRGEAAGPDRLRFALRPWRGRAAMVSAAVVVLLLIGWGGYAFRKSSPVVLGGVSSSIADWPWLVSVFTAGRFVCNGTLIAPRMVLSAANCVEELANYEVATATDDGEYLKIGMRIPVTKVVAHPAHSDIAADIAVLELGTELPPPFATISAQRSADPKVGTLALVGSIDFRSKPGNLLQSSIAIFDDATCAARIAPGLEEMGFRMNAPEVIICGGFERGGAGACPRTGSAGGPLVVFNGAGQKYQIGIVSVADCSVPKQAFGIYTRISSYADWIKQVVPDVLSEPMTEVKR